MAENNNGENSWQEIVSIENYDPSSYKRINSPTSLKAMEELGIKMFNLRLSTREDLVAIVKHLDSERTEHCISVILQKNKLRIEKLIDKVKRARQAILRSTKEFDDLYEDERSLEKTYIKHRELEEHRKRRFDHLRQDYYLMSGVARPNSHYSAITRLPPLTRLHSSVEKPINRSPNTRQHRQQSASVNYSADKHKRPYSSLDTPEVGKQDTVLLTGVDASDRKSRLTSAAVAREDSVKQIEDMVDYELRLQLVKHARDVNLEDKVEMRKLELQEKLRRFRRAMNEKQTQAMMISYKKRLDRDIKTFEIEINRKSQEQKLKDKAEKIIEESQKVSSMLQEKENFKMKRELVKNMLQKDIANLREGLLSSEELQSKYKYLKTDQDLDHLIEANTKMPVTRAISASRLVIT